MIRMENEQVGFKRKGDFYFIWANIYICFAHAGQTHNAVYMIFHAQELISKEVTLNSKILLFLYALCAI